MTLLSTRQQFIKRSGRFDLATTDVSEFDTDNGADWFINSGMKMLDRMDRTARSTSRRFDELAVDSWYQIFTDVRVIEQVWVNDSESRWKLEKVDLAALRDYYDGLISATDSGNPLYYAPALLRAEDLTDQDAQGAFFNYALDPSTDPHTQNGVVFFPPCDSAIVLEVIGQFYTTAMSSNTDINFWTVNHEDILVWAALYKLEISYRNTAGARDWLEAIKLEMKDIGSDFVEEEIVDVEEMEG